MNNFRGDLSGIAAKKEALLQRSLRSPCLQKERTEVTGTHNAKQVHNTEAIDIRSIAHHTIAPRIAFGIIIVEQVSLRLKRLIGLDARNFVMPG